jgi:Flp pilus assembly protein TadG
MRTLHLQSGRKRFLAAVARFKASASGTAAIEFGFIAPLMMFMFLGAVELSQAVSADRRVSQAAGTAGDLIAQAPSNTDPDVDYIQNVVNTASFLMEPFKSEYLTITLRSVTSSAASATATTEIWRCVYNGANPTTVTCTCPASGYTIPTGLVSTQDGVIVAETNYGYHPLVFDFFMKMSRPSAGGVYTMTEKLYLKPRNRMYIPLQLTVATKCDVGS